MHCDLGAVMFANDNNFCSIDVDPSPQGDLNNFYDGIKRGNQRTTIETFKGSFKEVVGSYDITALWYVRQKSSMHMTAVGNIQNSMAFPVMEVFHLGHLLLFQKYGMMVKILSIPTMVLSIMKQHFVGLHLLYLTIWLIVIPIGTR